MSKYMKKPVVIEAIQWTKENDIELEHWLSKEKSVELEIDDRLYVAGVGTPYISKIQIKTLEGTMEASYGDYIIKGINGEIYPCKPDIFEKTYEQPKQYLKWEDLEFKKEEQTMKVILNGKEYILKYEKLKDYDVDRVRIIDECCYKYMMLHTSTKQFFNDLRLERVEE